MVPLTTERKVTLGSIVCYVSFCQFSFFFPPSTKEGTFPFDHVLLPPQYSKVAKYMV